MDKNNIQDHWREAMSNFGRLCTIVEFLRSKDGCPWDREQDPMSIRANIIEEAYELSDSIVEDKTELIKEEAGDLYMLATMSSYMFEQAGRFKISESLAEACEKLIRRHPHVFGDVKVASATESLERWQEIKETIEGKPKKDSILDSIAKSLPPLERAEKLQKKAKNFGFDWASEKEIWDKLFEEISEVKTAQKEGPNELELEIGDLFLTLVSLAKKLGVDPSLALHTANEKFVSRFKFVENKLKYMNFPTEEERRKEMEVLWKEAKK